MPHWLWPLKARAWKGLLPSEKHILMTILATDVTRRKGWFRGRNWDKGVWLEHWGVESLWVLTRLAEWSLRGKTKIAPAFLGSGLAYISGTFLPSCKALIQDAVCIEGEAQLQPMPRRLSRTWLFVSLAPRSAVATEVAYYKFSQTVVQVALPWIVQVGRIIDFLLISPEIGSKEKRWEVSNQ